MAGGLPIAAAIDAAAGAPAVVTTPCLYPCLRRWGMSRNLAEWGVDGLRWYISSRRGGLRAEGAGSSGGLLRGLGGCFVGLCGGLSLGLRLGPGTCGCRVGPGLVPGLGLEHGLGLGCGLGL